MIKIMSMSDSINRFAFHEANGAGYAVLRLSNLRSLGRSFVVYATQDDSAFYFKRLDASSLPTLPTTRLHSC